MRAVALTEDKIFIAHQIDTQEYLFGVVCTISNTTITVGIDTQLSEISYSGNGISVALLQNKVFVAHTRKSGSGSYSSGYCLKGLFVVFDNLVQPIVFSTDDIYGIAKTTAQEGQQVDVYRPLEEVAV